MDELLQSLMQKFDIASGSLDEAELREMILDAVSIYLNKRYSPDKTSGVVDPFSMLGFVGKRWVRRAAIIFFSKTGADGQISHSENGIVRNWGAADIPQSMLDEVLSEAVVVSARS